MALSAHCRQPPVGSPRPVTDDWIDEPGNGKAVKEVAHEPGPTDHRARRNRRTGVGKGKLEDPDGQKGDARAFIGCRSILQEEPVISNETVPVTEHESEAECIEEDATKARVHDTFHEHVHRLPGATKTSLQHGEPDLHAEYQEGSNERPGGVNRINHIGSFDFGISREDMAEEDA